MGTENVTGQNDSAEFDAAFKEFADGPQPGAEAAKDVSTETPKEGNDTKPGDQQSETESKASTETPQPEASSDGGGKDGNQPSADPAKSSGDGDEIDWSQVPEALRTRLQGEIQEIRSNRGRMRALQRELNTARGKLTVYEQPDQAAGKAAPGAKDGKGADKDAKSAADPAMEKLRTEYPEIAAPIEKQLEEIKDQNRKLAAEVGGITEVQKQGDLDQQWATLIEMEPHAATIAGSEPFKKWVAEQPQYVQDVVRKNHDVVSNGVEAADIINRFRTQTNWQPPKPANGGSDPTKTKRERQLNSSADVSGKGPGAASGPPDDFEKAFDHFAAQGQKK